MTPFQTCVVRGCAIFDLLVTGSMALPPFVATERLGPLLQWVVLGKRAA